MFLPQRVTMSELQLKVIGCGDAFASGGRNHSCFLLKTKGAGILLDLGGSAFAGLKQQSVDANQIDYIVISHLHGDHYGGLPYFLLDAGVNKRSKALTLIGPKGLREKIYTLMPLLYPGTRVLEKLNLRFVSFEAYKPMEFADFRLLALPVVHSKATDPHGIRIEVEQKVLAYSGDTEWTPNLLELAEGADLFICECNFYQAHIPGHLSYKVLRNHLAEFNVKRICLTHLGPDMIGNLQKVRLECLQDGQSISID
jgi:ribonuclease BN (tRNA processing enzyme)